MADGKTYSHLFVKVGRETPNAILLEDDEHGDVWLPWSQVEQVHRQQDGVRVVMTEWIAKQKGLI